MDKCSARVEAGEIPDETCVEEFFDLMDCINHCVGFLQCKLIV